MTKHCLNILLVEDEPAHAEAIRRAFQLFRARSEIRVARTLQEYQDLVRESCPDIALLDLNLPDGRAVEVLSSPPETGRFPVLIMTSFGDEQVAVEVLKAGALDYLVKSSETFSAMPRIVDRALREWTLLQARRQDQARILHLNSVLRGIRNVNQLITQSDSRQPLLQEACTRLVATMGYKTAWIAVRTADGSLRLGAQANVPLELAAQLDRQLAQGTVPSCVRGALEQGRLFSQTLSEEDCRRCAINGSYPRCGMLAARMEHREVLYGVMIAAVPEEFVGDQEEQSLFLELVDDISLAIYRQDLEEQHQAAQLALARSEARYRELVENLEDVVFSTDPQGYLLYMSPAVQRVYGYAPEELVGHHFQEFVHPEDLPGLAASFQRSIEGVVVPYEFRGLDKQGNVHHLRSTTRLRREEGRPAGVTGVLIDLSALHHALEAQRLSAARWQATFDAISDLVAVISTDHEFVEINQAGCASLGLAKEQIIGRKCYELAHGTTCPIPVCPCQIAVQQNTPSATRHQAGGKSYDLLAWPIAGTDGHPSGFVHIVKDVTVEVEATTEKAQLEEQLKLSQRLEAVGRLAGGVAHDFNNLLSVIINYASFVSEELHASDPLRQDIVEIQNAAHRAAALIRQLLAFSRKQLLEPQLLDLNKVVTGIESMLRRLLGEDIAIEVHLGAELGSIMADPGQIEQVIMNLAVNARDAMPQGGKLTIETQNVALDEDYADQHVALKPGHFVRLSVTDTGAGMEPETRDHIFEPFFTTKAQGKGTGLGLSTVYGIVKQSGGNIWVYSEPGRGTTFKVYLPRLDAPAAAIKRRPAAIKVTGNERVLIVEDERAVRRLAERILSSAGYKVLSAASGNEALLLREVQAGELDLLLTDVVMPQMSGRKLAELLASSSPQLKVLYMSGYTDNAIVHHGVLDPGTHFISKPFSAAELMRKVREVLDRATA